MNMSNLTSMLGLGASNTLGATAEQGARQHELLAKVSLLAAALPVSLAGKWLCAYR